MHDTKNFALGKYVSNWSAQKYWNSEQWKKFPWVRASKILIPIRYTKSCVQWKEVKLVWSSYAHEQTDGNRLPSSRWWWKCASRGQNLKGAGNAPQPPWSGEGLLGGACGQRQGQSLRRSLFLSVFGVFFDLFTIVYLPLLCFSSFSHFRPILVENGKPLIIIETYGELWKLAWNISSYYY